MIIHYIRSRIIFFDGVGVAEICTRLVGRQDQVMKISSH